MATEDLRYCNSLSDLSKNIVDDNVLDKILNVLLEKFCKAIHAEAGTLWFFDKEGNKQIYPRSVYGKSKLENVSVKYGAGIVGNVVKDNSPLIVSDCSKDERWNSNVDSKTGFSTKSLICVPLTIKNSKYPFGAIQILNKTDDSLFDDNDLDYAKSLADECVKLLEEQLDKKTLEVLGKKRVSLDLDYILNLKSIDDVMKQLDKSLKDNGYSGKKADEIIASAINIWEILNK